MDKRIKVLALLVMLVLVVAPAMAEDGGGHGGEGHHFSWVSFFGKIFNSTVLFGGLIFFLRKPLINLMAQKSLDIKTDIVQREELLQTTTRQLEDIKARLKKIEEEVVTMKESAEKSGIDEKERMEAMGKKEAQRIVDLTAEEIDSKVETSIRNLKAKIADLTIDHFRKDIQAHLDKKAHEKIIEKNIEISGDIIERE